MYLRFTNISKMSLKEKLISKLGLIPHPEGGYYKETYRSESETEVIYDGLVGQNVRNYSTCIYYLLTDDTFSAFHRIRQDEIWHFYSGNPIHLYTISPEGEYKEIFVGSDIENDEVPQYVVPAGFWFAARVEKDFALAGCTVSPGFDFSDFELANRDELMSKFPHCKEIILSLTR